MLKIINAKKTLIKKYSYNDEDNQEIIDFAPNIVMKLALKNDETANRDN